LPLRSLASHSSGLPEWPANFAPRADSLFSHYRSDELLSALAEDSARELPSGQYRYSSYGPAVLGLALATVLGKSYAEACAEYVLRPAGMDRAHFGGGASLTSFGVFAPAGALTATGGDLQAWLAHLLWPKDEAWSECLSRIERVRLVTGVNRMAMASGWHVRVGDSGPVHWHNGRTPLGRAFVGISRDRKRGVVLVASHDVDLDGLGFAWLGRTSVAYGEAFYRGGAQ
jgi:serine-type D-Ala-D-Ala carboxypeptidase/endopeptidase